MAIKDIIKWGDGVALLMQSEVVNWTTAVTPFALLSNKQTKHWVFTIFPKIIESLQLKKTSKIIQPLTQQLHVHHIPRHHMNPFFECFRDGDPTTPLGSLFQWLNYPFREEIIISNLNLSYAA